MKKLLKLSLLRVMRGKNKRMLGVFTVSKDKLNLILKRVTVLNSSETFLLTMLPLKG